VSLFFSSAGLMVVAPLPEDDGRSADRYRIVATAATAAAAAPTLDDITALLRERGPGGAGQQVTQLLWSSHFHVAHRLAAEVCKDRTLLCGDAAHVHSPAGGQGMNTGIQDAIALAAHLAHAVQHGDEDGLQRWAGQRQAVAGDVVRMTDAMTRVATLSAPAARALRDAVLGLVGHLPFVRHKLAARIAELGN
jgi:2-polyprenyl-6-methoxyphenol hydroxylase-like FAD-dependent oxidoreductase